VASIACGVPCAVWAADGSGDRQAYREAAPRNNADRAQPAPIVPSNPLPLRFEASQSNSRRATVAAAHEALSATATAPTSKSTPPSKGFSRPQTDTALPLARPQDGDATNQKPPAAMPGLWSVFGSLTVVLGLLFATTWLLKRTMPKGSEILPRDVVEVLGRTPLAARQTMQLVRCGQKLVLLNVSPGGAETLTEIDDPAEVDRLTALCQRPAAAIAGNWGLRQLFPSRYERRSAGTIANGGRDRGETIGFGELSGHGLGRERTDG